MASINANVRIVQSVLWNSHETDNGQHTAIHSLTHTHNHKTGSEINTMLPLPGKFPCFQLYCVLLGNYFAQMSFDSPRSKISIKTMQMGRMHCTHEYELQE